MPKDGTVHELTSNVGAALGGSQTQQGRGGHPLGCRVQGCWGTGSP